MSCSAVDIQTTNGPGFIGIFVSSVLYGVSICQTWMYYWHYRKRDSKALIGFVGLLFVLDTLHTVLCVYMMYWYLIVNFGNVAKLNADMWALNAQVIVNAFICYLVQIFYARRLYIMSKNIVVPVIVVLLGGVTLADGFIYAAEAARLEQYSRFNTLIWVISTGSGSSAVADILIALSMCWCLYRKKTGLSNTDSIIMTLIIYSIVTGLLTSILATVTLITFVLSPFTLLTLAFYGPMGRCYVNSLLAVLNNRDFLRERTADSDNLGNSEKRSTFAMATRHQSKTGPASVSVVMHQTAATADFAGSKHDYGKEPRTMELQNVQNLGASITSSGVSVSIV
ncbi:hypothetical protein BJV74DRAFT_161685 [Russula compacta]|nr:hypothetical protein BJV74DRAFT_161685 [Russula compacta]